VQLEVERNTRVDAHLELRQVSENVTVTARGKEFLYEGGIHTPFIVRLHLNL